MNEIDLVIPECPTMPIPDGDYWVYSCGLTIVKEALPVISDCDIVIAREAHRLHHLDYHEPLLPRWTISMMTKQHLAFCADCLHTKPLIVEPYA